MANAPRDSIVRVSGPDSMALPQRSTGAGEGSAQNASNVDAFGGGETPKPKKKRHRGGRNHKRKNRRQSFAVPSEATESVVDGDEQRPSLLDASRANASQQDSFYRLQGGRRGSNTSLESEALLDHREHAPFSSRSRRETIKQSFARVSQPFTRHQHRSSEASMSHQRSAMSRSKLSQGPAVMSGDDDDEQDGAQERTPLLARRSRKPDLSRNNSGYNHGYNTGVEGLRNRRTSNTSKASSRRRMEPLGMISHNNLPEEPYDVNNPPSVPGSPTIGSMDDLFIAGASSDRGRDRDAIISIDEHDDDRRYSGSPEDRRRATVAELASKDVCFPGEDDATDIGDGEETLHADRDSSQRRRRKRGKVWPDLDVLEDWSREEKEERTHQDLLRAKKISEPVMVGGRLRPVKTNWHRQIDESPFRFTYFNETLDSTIHARTISDLQDGCTFKELFRPDPPEICESSEDEDDCEDEGRTEDKMERPPMNQHRSNSDGTAKKPSVVPDLLDRPNSVMSNHKSVADSAPASGLATPKPKQKRYGNRPTFWLDVLKPTETEMKVISKAFGIHQLTSEDILMDEPREKVELFPHYYFVNYRTFEQDKDDEEYMEPINMFVLVFRDGVISFHHSESPHPANVRRRVRQLNDYMSPTADWISYAIIDDVTDVYAPLVSEIEKEVDEIDEDILYMHTTAADQAEGKVSPSQKKPAQRPKSQGKGNTQADAGAAKSEGEKITGSSGGDMLRRVGECRKKVMGLYRLLGNKADVIKGFAKRCNEQWDVAPRSEIGLYLGDIQDHIVTMTGNLSHFESLLSRAHGNYVAQINIRMNERAEQNADVLGKLTVLGTIVLPMNIITGMWGMNVWVPGQEYEGDLTWFWCITAGLLAFGVTCYFIAKRVYGIV
ncbi:Putative metal ion transporter [Fulvia fulva]|uniref:Metal ion transporter n=1 Tax=Passalora fulva TaxID=5499 RepID=A0A9Q8PGL6_PASFU|nr:Putative metal ion transporter [Fulvia fulva]KAK4613824.1 putative metal ion transporter [Fulvia fulva]KAK4614747.1 putative metal ion transporter [Fulvia fulva]UJO22140.1 Putative metal ion transporter [Fulvia fulva]WPV20453.1 Putative metal ion transporter [Fulvia fulva]WPV34870.1 Putative metal ion transporter [Fulvia fulva]